MATNFLPLILGIKHDQKLASDAKVKQDVQDNKDGKDNEDCGLKTVDSNISLISKAFNSFKETLIKWWDGDNIGESR